MFTLDCLHTQPRLCRITAGTFGFRPNPFFYGGNTPGFYFYSYLPAALLHFIPVHTFHYTKHAVFSAEMANCRREYFKIVLRATLLIILLTWCSLPMCVSPFPPL